MVKSILADELFQNKQEVLLVDVRTPAEYQFAHIPNAVNIPLLSNEERVVVGTTYKQVGRSAAVSKGFEFVGPRWSKNIYEIEQHAAGRKVIVHCWRGGMRSGAMAWALDLYGLPVLTIQGGYKAYRKYLHEIFERKLMLQVLSGKTGCGKTILLQELKALGEQVLDLEDIAQHRGSTFGSLGYLHQPTQEQFENNIAEVIKGFNLDKRIWVESESVVIGRCTIPRPLFLQMLTANAIDVQMPYETRVEYLVQEYGILDKEFMKYALMGISKRLGPEQTKEALLALKENRMHDFMRWALQYYDKQYEKSLLKRNTASVQQLCFTYMNHEKNAKDLLPFVN